MPSRPRVEYSVFVPEFVSRLVERKWGWKRARCEFWNRGMSDTYRVEQGGRCAYLKVYRRGLRARGEIQGEVDLLRFLSSRQISVSRPIRGGAGAFVEQIDAPEGRRYAVLFAEAKGAEPEINPANCRHYGRLVGAVHKATDSCPASIKRPLLGIDHLAREPLGRIGPYLARRPRDFAYLARVSEELAEAIVALLPVTPRVFGICHGDVTFGNLRRDSRGRFTLFDFDCSGYGWRSYDVAISLWSHGYEFSGAAKANRRRMRDAFLDGYHAVRRLSQAELQAVDMFVPLRQIWQLGVQSNLWAGFGRRALHDTNLDAYLEFIKTWLKVYKPI